MHVTVLSLHVVAAIAGVDPGGGVVPRVPWNPPFERASLTRDTLIEQSQ